MACDHNTVTHTTLEEKYILVYCSDRLIMADYTGGQTSSCHTVEIFADAQGLLDRGLDLGLACSIPQLLSAAEHGAVLNDFCVAYLMSEVWDMDIDLVRRAEALGYVNPN